MSTDTPQARLREKLRQKRSELILEVAEELLLKKGYANASMDEIAAHAGVAKGTLYQHFLTKEDLFFALFEKALIRFEQVVQQAVDSSRNARQKLESILSYVYGEHRGEHVHLLQLLRRNADLSQRLQAKQGHSRERMDQVIQQLRRILEDGKAEGLFTTAVTTDLMLHLFLHLLSLSGDEHLPSLSEEKPEELISQLEHLLFLGIQKEEIGAR